MEQKRLLIGACPSNIDLKEKSSQKNVFKKGTTSYQEAVEYSSQLIIQSPCIPYIPELGERVGVYSAVLLQQIHYWTQKGFAEKKHGKLWVHNKYEAWAQQLRCSLSCIRKTVKKLKQEGLIETKAFRSRYGDTTKWYAVNYNALGELGLKLNSETALQNNGAACPQNTSTALTALNENNVPDQDKKAATSPLQKADGRVLQCDVPLNKISKVINNLSPACAESVYKHMISIWNETVHKGPKPILLTEKRLKWLKRRFETDFNSSIEEWERYCSKIANNDFLMGTGKRGWTATFDWAIDPLNIQKVLTNHYQRWEIKKKDEPKGSWIVACKSQAEIEAETQESLKKIEASFHPPFWKEASKALVGAFGAGKFESWISQLIPERLEGGGLILHAPTRFVRDWVERNYAQAVLDACKRIDPEIKNIEFKAGYVVLRQTDAAQSKVQKEIQETAEQIETSSHPEFWKAASKRLLSELGAAKFKGWISQIRIQDKYENGLVLKAASQRSLVWLKRNFSDSILECCQKLDPKISYLEFVCE